MLTRYSSAFCKLGFLVCFSVACFTQLLDFLEFVFVDFDFTYCIFLYHHSRTLFALWLFVRLHFYCSILCEYSNFPCGAISQSVGCSVCLSISELKAQSGRSHSSSLTAWCNHIYKFESLYSVPCVRDPCQKQMAAGSRSVVTLTLHYQLRTESECLQGPLYTQLL